MTPTLSSIVKGRITEGRLTTRHARGQRPMGMTRTYDCESLQHARCLVNELLELGERTHHRTRVVVDGTHVVLETWTPNQGITELDEEYCAEADVIFEDTRCWR